MASGETLPVIPGLDRLRFSDGHPGSLPESAPPRQWRPARVLTME